jgi:phosphate-selective porin OprO/OprP
VGLLLGSGPVVHAEEDENFKVFWKEGLRMETADKQFKLRIGGRVHNDFVWWEGENEIQAAIGDDIGDGNEFRRARLYVAGEIYEHVIVKAEYDFAGGESQFKDVFVGLRDVPYVNMVRVGHFKEPFSLEELTSSNYTTFMERALPNIFAPSRNTGVGVNTGFLEDRITLGVGTFRDTDDFGDSAGDNFQFSGRLTGLPLYQNEGEQLVTLGFSYRYQNPDGGEIQIDQRPEVHRSPQFVDTGLLAVDDLSTYGFEAAAVFGPFSVQGEYIFADITSDDDDPLLDTDDPFLSGWYLFGSWLVTGEHRLFKADEAAFAGVKPKANFMQGGPGAIELGLRYSSLDLDDQGATGGELGDVTAGINWYLNHNARVMFNYVYADLEDVDGAHAFMTRFQFNI